MLTERITEHWPTESSPEISRAFCDAGFVIYVDHYFPGKCGFW